MPKEDFDKNKKSGHNDTDAEEEFADDIIAEEEAEGQQTVLKRMREKLKACERERQEYLDGWQRARADIHNARQEQAREIERQSERKVDGLIAELLPVLDSFDTAFGDAQTWQRVDETWRTGVENIYNQLNSVLTRLNVSSFDPAGAVFDPAFHEPVATEQTNEEKLDNTVAKVFQKGYTRDNTVIRPAKVSVYQYDSQKT